MVHIVHIYMLVTIGLAPQTGDTGDVVASANAYWQPVLNVMWVSQK